MTYQGDRQMNTPNRRIIKFLPVLAVVALPVILGASAIYIGTISKFIASDTLAYMVKTWPIDFFPNSIYAILPVQFVPFAVLGAMTGYWISIYMKHHAEHPE